MVSSSPSLLLFNGKIYPFAAPSVSVEALAIKGEFILGLGSKGEVAKELHGQIQHLDLAGKVILPGLSDAHIHLENYALSLERLNCATQTLSECLDRIAERVSTLPVGSWILGHGWDQNQWGSFATAADLDAVAPDHPTFLTAHSLHAAWANSAALRLAGISQDTPDPSGGALQRTTSGAPTGILFENAIHLVSDKIPRLEPDALAPKLYAAQETLWQLGITAIHDFDGPNCLQGLQILHASDELGLRVLKHIPMAQLDAALDLGLRSGFGNRWLRIGNIKVFADGALGPRTAAMIEPYETEPQNRGMLIVDKEELADIGFHAAEAGFGLAIHAIGDLANHEALDAIQAVRAFESERGLTPLRHRIEHLQLMHPEDLTRPGQLQVVASMQPIHAISDMRMAEQYWGQRSEYAYAWRSQLDSRALLVFGSDAPVEDPNPFLGLHAAISRRRNDGKPGPDGWISSQRIGLAEALGAYTSGPALAAGMDARAGMLQPGFFADLIVLERDPYQISPEEIRSLAPVGTMVGGRWRFRSF